VLELHGKNILLDAVEEKMLGELDVPGVEMENARSYLETRNGKGIHSFVEFTTCKER
jgi:hypothetical protein